MFTKEELLVIEDALKIADEKYIKLLDESKNNKFYTLAHTLENEDYAHIFDDTLGHKSKKIDFKQYAQKAFA